MPLAKNKRQSDLYIKRSANKHSAMWSIVNSQLRVRKILMWFFCKYRKIRNYRRETIQFICIKLMYVYPPSLFCKISKNRIIYPLTQLTNIWTKNNVFRSSLKGLKWFPFKEVIVKFMITTITDLFHFTRLSKLLKSLMMDEVMNLFGKNSLLTETQYIVPCKESITLLSTSEQITFLWVGNKGLTSALLCLIWLKSLIVFLQIFPFHNFHSDSIHFVRNYATGRSYYLLYNNTSSDNKCLNYGVPQGSVLESLLFLVYILQAKVAGFKLILFAYHPS